MQHPSHLRETAVWLYVRHELPYREVADRLFIDESAVREWVAQKRLGRTRSAAARLRYDKPERKAKKLRAFQMSESGMRQQEIADRMGVSQATVSKYVRDVKDFRANQRLTEVYQ